MSASVQAASAAEISVFSKIQKRGGRIVSFDINKITLAILKAGRAGGEFGEPEARRLTIRVKEI